MQTLTTIKNLTIPTHTLTPIPFHTSTPASFLHPDPSPALQRSLFDTVPPRKSGDSFDSHVQRKEESSSEPKPPQRPRGPPSAPDGKVVKPEQEPRQNASELGLLLVGLSAGLGMAVAVGLRYLQRKHCRRHTAMSLGERSHGNRGVIHVQECGDLVQQEDSPLPRTTAESGLVQFGSVCPTLVTALQGFQTGCRYLRPTATAIPRPADTPTSNKPSSEAFCLGSCSGFNTFPSGALGGPLGL
ncbi:hypothetical protein NFI96_030163 [Prochilodus magdalenae]|nr:hypothetical protein NFI96_030163 [Prochilodus magdalenae]